jgi:hypothetical protein
MVYINSMYLLLGNPRAFAHKPHPGIPLVSRPRAAPFSQQADPAQHSESVFYIFQLKLVVCFFQGQGNGREYASSQVTKASGSSVTPV